MHPMLRLTWFLQTRRFTERASRIGRPNGEEAPEGCNLPAEGRRLTPHSTAPASLLYPSAPTPAVRQAYPSSNVRNKARETLDSLETMVLCSRYRIAGRHPRKRPADAAPLG